MNIGDIAELAGVSRAAVSRYLNDGYISKEKKERIRKVIEETGYKPSVMAQTLRTKKTRLIGVILPRINSDTISSVVAGIGEILSESGYDMLIAATDMRPEKEVEYLRIFSKNRVDAVILIATVFLKDHLKILKEMTIPVVIVGQRLEGYSCIYHDDYEAGRAVALKLLKTGRTKIGYIGVIRDDVAVGQKRFEGVEEALKSAGYPLSPEYTAIGSFSITSGAEKTEELLGRCRNLDAIICATDRLAVGALGVLKKSGRNVPRDVALVGFGDNEIGRVTSPTISTVHFHYHESGRRAAQIVMDQLVNGSHATTEVRLGFDILGRESTDVG